MSTSHSILDPLLAGLAEGSIPVGARLAAERDLAARFGASRVCVREALAQLSAWRVIEVRRGSGAIVKPREGWSLAVLPATLGATAGPLPAPLQEAAVSALALRRTLLRQALPVVALRLPAAGEILERTRAAVESAWEARRDAEAFVWADTRALQVAFAGADAWPAAWLAGDLAAVAGALAGRRETPLPVPADYVGQHGLLLDALAASQDASADRLLSRHLARLDRALLEG